ncbi:MAG: DNA repair protein RadA [Deltaproteobacteria bacterium]|nr:MAG: DNA repair protein RadA [Deltaproteobacteria bacterium]
MAKATRRAIYVCQACGHTESRWLGRCPQCGEWNALVEEAAPTAPRAPAAERRAAAQPIAIDQVADADPERRLATRIGELDRVLGGGLVAGSLVLLGGEPGIGKSTLLLQALRGIAEQGARVLYVTGEESAAQTAMRARRVGAVHPNISLLAETHLERILAAARAAAPAVLAVDSIQTLHTELLESIPGSVGQVRDCTARLLGYAKSEHVPTILVGHVTKDGAIAGPKTLEHVVDAVLQFEGEGASPYRVLRASKNRFGSTQELGVFEMAAGGLAEVVNPSELFLAERTAGAPGSVVVASAEGTRPILVEVQALVAPPSAGVGRRTAAGVDGNRVSLLLAVLAQRAGCDVISQDVFVNVAGGVRLAEPAIDLGVACAVASSARGRAVDPRTVVFGEVGLAGEVRAVHLAELRLAEAAKLGFTRAIVPAHNAKRLDGTPALELVPVRHVDQALDAL